MTTNKTTTATKRVVGTVGKYRYVILAVLFFATALNYVDRATFAVTQTKISEEFGLGADQIGWISSMFAWAITAVVIIFGWLIQRFGSRIVGGVGLLGFSAATMLTATATGFAPLLIWRILLGVFEAPTFPVNSILTRRWFPRVERHRSVSTYMIGSFVGLAFAAPLLGLLLKATGSWHSVFLVSGLAGFVVGAAWFMVIRNTPGQSKNVTRAERLYIEQDEEIPAPTRKTRASDWRNILTDRRMWGMFVGVAGTSTVVFFFITWFPSYLKASFTTVNAAGKTVPLISIADGSLLGSLPYIFGILGLFASGFVSDRLVRRGMSSGRARKIPVTLGLLGATTIAFVPLLPKNDVGLAMVFLCFVFFCAGLANTAWLLVSEVAQPKLLGLSTGIYGFFTNLFGALTPVIVGYLLTSTNPGVTALAKQNYAAVLVYVGVAALIGALGYIFLLDKVEPNPSRQVTD